MLDLNSRPLIMGILNVTPDSFSDGGRYSKVSAAVDRGCRMREEGADIIDVGGESTRPGAQAVSAGEEANRVIPVIRALAGKTDATISVDTMKAAVAESAVEAGAHIINDVSAMTHDPGMEEVARKSEAGVVLMHMRGMPRTMQADPNYEDVVGEVHRYLRDRIEELVRKGFDKESLAVDPGIGFGKTVEHNLSLLANLDAFLDIGVPLVVGLSRKSFLGRITGRDVGDRLPASIAGLVFCVLKGVHVVRVHDVEASYDAARTVAALEKKHVALG